MYQAKAVPDLLGASTKALSSAISFGADTPTPQINDQALQSIIHTAMDTPLTPITLIAAYGGLQTLRFTFKLIKLVAK